MTYISKTHQEFSIRLNNPRVLEYPQEFLGPNYEAVLDFWLFLAHLTEDQLKTINCRYKDFRDNHLSEWKKAADEELITSEETTGLEFANNAAYAADAANDAYWATIDATWVSNAAYWATRELIGDVPNKVFHRMFDDL